ncbi:MAG: hypothetical protein PHZ26_05315 [Candidatus Gracilibacteria bacterium]|nr:hypothetical protein [Candidatus Gracilibacteria bacterium]MDD2909135.1 hypothetical protein [Candidatus Gracilibacteria bacterium]
MEGGIINIDILGSFKTTDCFNGINTINNAIDIDEFQLFFSDQIHIKIDSIFLPSKILIYLGHFLHKYETLGKDIHLSLSTKKLYNFVTGSGFSKFINTREVQESNLPDSVILPFSKVGTQIEFRTYLDKFKGRLIYSKSEIIEFISELQYNSIEHGRTSDIYIMGQMYPSNKLIDITVYDAGLGMTSTDFNKIVEEVYDNFTTKEFYEYICKLYGLNVYFIILCTCTSFSTKGLNVGGWGLLNLSKFLYSNNGIIQIITGKTFVELKFNKICSKLDNNSLILKVNEMSKPIVGTYISFTFSV